MIAITYEEFFLMIRDNQLWLGNRFKVGNAHFVTDEIKNYAEEGYNAETGLVKFRN